MTLLASPDRKQQPFSGARRASIGTLATFFVCAGVFHFIRLADYVNVVPEWLPQPRVLVYASGLCEIAGGLGLLTSRTRSAAAWGLMALLVAVFPANIQMLVAALGTGRWGMEPFLLALRLPAQPLLIAWVWVAAGRRKPMPLIAPVPTRRPDP
ncbi:MAG: DoxX family protein [Gemmatimonadaceae bacterium]